MRYHSSLPLRAQPPSRPSDPLAIQRSQPTKCVLSLANVTVSMVSSATSTGPVDPLAVSVPLSDIGSSSAVPFSSSKRTHSLLRATSSLSQCLSEYATSSPNSDSHSSSDPDFNPPRKRTRTSALFSSSRPRSQRCNSSPSRVSVASVHLTGSLAPLPMPSPPSCISLMSMKSTYSSPSSKRHRRRMMPGEVRVLLYLYRTLVCGLGIRHPNLLTICGVDQQRVLPTGAKVVIESSISDDSATGKSHLDMQDALLVQHLKTYLLANGISAYMLVVNTESVAQGRPTASTGASDLVESGAMLVDDDLSDIHPHIHQSTTHTVLSYQQLVATLLIRQCLYPRRPPTKLSSKRSSLRRPRSKLSHSLSLD